MMRSVSESMRWLAAGDERRFLSVEEAWRPFLDYLEARHAVGLAGPKQGDLAEIRDHLTYIESVIDDPVDRRDGDAAARLEAFGKREDVIEVFERFRKEQMLPSPRPGRS
jgi:hypothetical protein